MWNTTVREVSVATTLYQAEALLKILRSIDENIYPAEACKIRDIFDLITERVRDQLRELTINSALTPIGAARTRKLGRLLQEIHSYIRFLQASDPAKSPPEVQIALTEFTMLYFPRHPDSSPPVTLVRPQWQYNLTFRSISRLLRNILIPADLDPNGHLGASTADELVEALGKQRAANCETSEEKRWWSNLPKHLAVLSFAGLDRNDSLQLPILCHELGHFIDLGREAPPNGAKPSDPKYSLSSSSEDLVIKSFVTRDDFRKAIVAESQGQIPATMILNNAYTQLLIRIDSCRCEILADLLATRMCGLSFFMSLAHFLKSLTTWPQERVTRAGYPGFAFRVELVLEELLRSGSIHLLDDLATVEGSPHKSVSEEILKYLDSWKQWIDEVPSSVPPSNPGDMNSVIAKVSNDLAIKAIDAVVPLLRDVAAKIIVDDQIPKLTPKFFARVQSLANDVPPSFPRDTIKDAFSEILSAAWVYQTLYGSQKEKEKSEIEHRFVEYQKTCRLAAKAIELASLTSGKLLQDQGDPPPIITSPNEIEKDPSGTGQAHGTCSKADILGRMRQANPLKRLTVVPHFPKSVQTASLDVHLGHWFKISRKAKLKSINLADDLTADRLIALSQEEVFVGVGKRLIMHPGDLVLGTTLEFVALPDDLIAFVEGKSQLGRRGLIVATATQVAPGFHGVIVLELINSGMVPLELAPGMGVAQMIFQTLTNPVPQDELYRGSSFCQIRP